MVILILLMLPLSKAIAILQNKYQEHQLIRTFSSIKFSKAIAFFFFDLSRLSFLHFSTSSAKETLNEDIVIVPSEATFSYRRSRLLRDFRRAVLLKVRDNQDDIKAMKSTKNLARL